MSTKLTAASAQNPNQFTPLHRLCLATTKLDDISLQLTYHVLCLPTLFNEEDNDYSLYVHSVLAALSEGLDAVAAEVNEITETLHREKNHE